MTVKPCNGSCQRVQKPSHNSAMRFFYKAVPMIIVFITLLCVAGLRPVGADRDSPGYARKIEGSSVEYPPDFRSVEPTFWLITSISKDIFPDDPVQSVFFVYALLGIGLKFLAIHRCSKFSLTSMYVYFGTYFFLYETTQIRVGVASAFLLLSVQNIAQKNLKSFLLKACAAFLFHYQSLVMLPLYFLKANRVNKVFYSVLPIVGILLGKTRLFDGILKNSLIFFPEILSFKLNSYLILQEHGVFAELNVLRSTYMYGLLIFYYSILLLSDRISKKEDVISLKIFGWGIFSYYSLPFLPVLSVRISEFLLVTIIFVLPSMIGLLKERFLPFLAVVIFTTLRLASLLLQYRLFVL